MRRLLMLFLLAALLFAVGGGGDSGGPPSRKDYALTYSLSCPGNTLVVTTTEGGEPLVDVTAKLHKAGFRIATGLSDSSGETRFTISESGRYQVYTSKNGYRTKDASFQLSLCETEEPGSEEVWMCGEGAREDRLRCRLRLPKEDIGAVRYVPEECRDQSDADTQKCVGWYRLFQTCRDYETDAERTACIKPKLNISGAVHEVLAQCEGKTGTERAACVQQIKDNVLRLVKFRMYNLEYKAEEWLEAGVNEDDVVDVLGKIQDAKKAFTLAASFSEKKEVVKQLKQDWQDFLQEAKTQLGVEE